MKEYTEEEFVKALKDAEAAGLITGCFFLEETGIIKKHLSAWDTAQLGNIVRTKLNSSGIATLTQKGLFDKNGNFTNLGLGYVALFLEQRKIAEDPNHPINKPAEAIDTAGHDAPATESPDALAALYLGRHDIERIEKSYRHRDNLSMVYFLCGEMSSEHIRLLHKAGIIKPKADITEQGWSLIGRYIELTTGAAPAERQPSNLPEKKWWKFW
jgi:hypothetical protein